MNKEVKDRRKKRIRARVSGTANRPRASVYRSLRHISVQLVDDETGRTLMAANSFDLKKSAKNSKTDIGKVVGERLAVQAKKAGINKIVFDRNGCRYHGRIKALAEALRASGLEF